MRISCLQKLKGIVLTNILLSRSIIKSADFEIAYVKWNDEGLLSFPEGERQSPERSGELPDGEYIYRDYMVITYCCRRDAFYSNGIHLPIGKVPLLNVFCSYYVTKIIIVQSNL